MCGISGFLDLFHSANNEKLTNIAMKMTNTIRHRGPDDLGVWVDEKVGVALGHRRLSIKDLSSEGHQPMISANGRYVMVFNGEIYNHLALRNELEQFGYRFRGQSDTEVMMESIDKWGIDNALKKFIGMFAFALWDRKEQLLYLGRDRIGEKPLYYGWVNNTFLFGSEMKSLQAHPCFKADINRDAIALYLRYNCIPAPYSIFNGIYKLMPSSFIIINPFNTQSTPDPIHYWSLKETAEERIKNPFTKNDKEAIIQLDKALGESIKLQMVADVPLGAFLSGGIDSTTIVALMQAQSKQPIKTFTIGYREEEYNEAAYAKEVAKHLRTDHTELYVSPQQALDVIPMLPTMYDEPFSDSSQIPTFLVSKLARQHVTVSLTGDGGDELFGGYNRYIWGRKIWKKLHLVPKSVRKIIATSLYSLPSKSLKLEKFTDILPVESPEEMYHVLTSHWKNPESVVIGVSESSKSLMAKTFDTELTDFTEKMMYFDTITYLPNDILVKVDRASMAVSLESRAPFLDHRLVELAWSLPLSMKIRNGQSKWLLRQVLYQYVPRELMERPKAGFGVPISAWLRGPLREWAEELLNEKRLREEGFFHPEPIRQKWKEYLSNQRNWQHHIWDILMFQAWYENQVK